MAKSIDYQDIIGQVFTNSIRQRYMPTKHIQDGRKHRYTVVFINKDGKPLKNKAGEIKTLENQTRYQVLNNRCKYFEKKHKPYLENLHEKVVMGVDGSTNCTGYAVRKGCKILACSEITPPKGLEVDQRIDFMAKEVAKIAESFNVEVVFYEEPDNDNRSVPLWELQGVIRNRVLNKDFERIVPSVWKSFCGFTMGRQKNLRKTQKEESIRRASTIMNRAISEDASDAFNMLSYCVNKLGKAE